MAAGIRHGTFSPVSSASKKHGTAWMAGKKIMPMFEPSVKPNVALTVEKLTLAS